MAISTGDSMAISAQAPQLAAQPIVEGRQPRVPAAAGALPATSAQSVISAVQDVFAQPAVRRAFPAIGVLLVLLMVGAAYLWLQDTPYRPILPGISEVDQHAALEALKAANFNPKVDPATGNLLVPAAHFHEARMLLASLGLPKDRNRGVLESLKDQTALTTSQFMEQARYSAAIEQELSKSIEQIGSIQSARVHLAQPRQSAFLRDRVPAKASVVVTPFSGRMVSPGQVQAIVHLIASSVPYLSTEDVSVVDNLGNLLTKAPVDAGLGLTATQLQIKEQTEQTYRNRLMQLLEPIVGEGNVRAQVDLTMNFTQVETTSEDFDSNRQGPKTRSEQLAEERTNKTDASGVPGALSNTPPPQPENKQDVTATDEKNGASTPVLSSRSTRNYEIDKVVRHVKSSMGGIERVTVAVVIRERKKAADDVKEKEKGKGQDPQSGTANLGYSAEDLERMTAVVKGAVGFREDRGDVVNILPARFELAAGKAPPAWYENEMAANILKGALATLVLLAVLLGVVRPVVNSYLPPRPVQNLALAAPVAGADQSGTPSTAAADSDPSAGAAPEQPDVEEPKADAAADDPDSMVMAEGESLEDFRERLKKSAAPKKSTISADMLDTANTYDDKVALLRLLVAEDSGRVATVLKTMIRLDGGA